MSKLKKHLELAESIITKIGVVLVIYIWLTSNLNIPPWASVLALCLMSSYVTVLAILWVIEDRENKARYEKWREEARRG